MLLFVGHEFYRRTGYETHLPLAIPLATPVMDLCHNLDWLDDSEFTCSPQMSAGDSMRGVESGWITRYNGFGSRNFPHPRSLGGSAKIYRGILRPQ